MIDQLKSQALHLLHRDLWDLQIEDESIDEVVEVLRCTYNHSSTPTMEADGIGMDLRNVVIAFNGQKYESMEIFETFDDLVKKNRDFASDLLRKLMEDVGSD
jgi:iron uptake system EfeUOB component EfeO/EfeM